VYSIASSDNYSLTNLSRFSYYNWISNIVWRNRIKIRTQIKYERSNRSKRNIHAVTADSIKCKVAFNKGAEEESSYHAHSDTELHRFALNTPPQLV